MLKIKRLVKHVFQTLLLVGAVCLCILLGHDPWAATLMPFVWGLNILLILGGIGYALYRSRRTALRMIVVAIGVSLTVLAGPSMAQMEPKPETPNTNEEHYQNLKKISEDMCVQYNQFFGVGNTGRIIDWGAGDLAETKITKEQLTQMAQISIVAWEYVDAYKKAKQAGMKEESRGFFSWLAKKMHWTDPLENTKEIYECAVAWNEEMAKFQTLFAEKQLGTVKSLLELEQNDCWPCGLARLMMDAVEAISVALEDTLKLAALELLGIMFLFWILYKVLMLIGQIMVGAAKPGEFFTEFLTRFFIATIAVALLNAPMQKLYSMTLSPMIMATSGIAKAFVNASSNNETLDASFSEQPNQNTLGQRIINDVSLLSCVCCKDSDSTDCNGKSIRREDNKTLIDFQAKKELLCMTCTVYKQTAPFSAAGRVMMYRSFQATSWYGRLLRKVASKITGGVTDYIPYPFGMWIVGMFLTIAFTWLAALTAFRLVDVFLRLGFVFFLTPLLITAYVFPISRQYTKRAWDFFVHAMLSILAISMGMALVIAVFQASLPNGVITRLGNIMQKDLSNSGNEYAEELYAVFAGNPKASGDSASAFYILILIYVTLRFGIKMLKSCQVVIDGLSGLSSGIPGICGDCVRGAIKAALALARAATSAAKGGIDKAQAAKKKVDGKDVNKDDKEKKKEEKDGAVARGANRAGDAVEQKANAAGDKIDKGAEKAGDFVEKGGKKVGESGRSAGKRMMSAGSKISGTGLGAIAGVPLMLVGAAVYAGASIAQGAAWLGGQAVKGAGKVASATVRAGGRQAAKGIKAAGRRADRAVQKTRAMANRIKQAPGKLKNKLKNMPANAKKAFMRKTRSMRARAKYLRQRATGGPGASRWGQDGREHPNAGRAREGREARERDEQQRKREEEEAQRNAPRSDSRASRFLGGLENALDNADAAVDMAFGEDGAGFNTNGLDQDDKPAYYDTEDDIKNRPQ